MSRWYDCPICIGYCEEFIRPEDGKSICDSCETEVWFEPAPEDLKKRLYRAGLWCEEVVCMDDNGNTVSNPAFSNQDEYNRFVEWNAIRMGAVVDQIVAVLNGDEETDCG